MNLIKCFQTNSKWYKEAVRSSKPIGILWHDTGAGNATLKRYVQPMESDENYDDMIALLGKNKYNNDWNHEQKNSGVNAWIGKLADGSVATVQAGEWTMTPWGCGTGKYGSCNGTMVINGVRDYCGKHWIQFEICDDGYKDKAYFEAIYKEACELTALLCAEYGIDPNGNVEYNGITVPTILCHSDSYKLGLGSNHGDVYSWFKAMGLSKNMDQVRKDVSDMLANHKKDPAAEYILYTSVNMYSSASDAANQIDVKGHFQAGTYYLYNKYPDGYKGMLCLSKREDGSNGIGWMNPAENVIAEESVQEIDINTSLDTSVQESDNETENIIAGDDETLNEDIGDPVTDPNEDNVTTIQDPKDQGVQTDKIFENKKSLLKKFISFIVEIFVRVFKSNGIHKES